MEMHTERRAYWMNRLSTLTRKCTLYNNDGIILLFVVLPPHLTKNSFTFHFTISTISCSNQYVYTYKYIGWCLLNSKQKNRPKKRNTVRSAISWLVSRYIAQFQYGVFYSLSSHKAYQKIKSNIFLASIACHIFAGAVRSTHSLLYTLTSVFVQQIKFSFFSLLCVF